MSKQDADLGRQGFHRETRTGFHSRTWTLLALLLVLSGCRFSDIPPIEPLAVPAVEPLPYRVGVLPVRASFKPEEVAPGKPEVHAAIPDVAGVRRDLVTALQRSGRFARVLERGPADASALEATSEAWQEHDDLLLEVEVLSYRDEYLGHFASSYAWWFFMYTGCIFGGFFCPIDNYGAGIQARVVLRGISATEPLIDEVLAVKPEQNQLELTPLDRGIVGVVDFPAIWNVEGYLEAPHWRAIDDLVGPRAWRRLHLDLIREVDQKVREPLAGPSAAEREGVLRRARKRFSLVVGVQKYADPVLGAAADAAEDARAFAALLGKPEGGGQVAGRDLALLVDEEATRAGILDAVAAIASRASPSDEVLVYFAGLGASDPGVAAAASASGTALLLPHDAQPQALASTSLSLEALGAALDAVRASRVVVLLDTSFAGAERGARTFVTTGAAPTDESIRRALRAGDGRAVLCASRPDQPAHELTEGASSLFAYFLRAGIEGGAPREADGRIRLASVATFARTEVQSRSGLEDHDQEPIAIGAEEVELSWPR